MIKYELPIIKFVSYHRLHMSEFSKEPASAQKEYYVSKKDLPLSCPMPQMTLWNAHPKVYLPIEKSNKVSCPYCGATYILQDVPSHSS